jgi:hypothetical protein
MRRAVESENRQPGRPRGTRIEYMTQTMTAVRVHAIDPARLDAIRAAGHDGHGNPLLAYPAEGWEPVRCCLRVATPGEQIALISFAPFAHPSPWTEVGPVFMHAEACAGHAPEDGLPAQLRTGPRVLRTYRADDTLDYEDIAIVGDGEDIAPALDAALARPEVATVHVRAFASQCFLFAVTAG